MHQPRLLATVVLMSTLAGACGGDRAGENVVVGGPTAPSSTASPGAATACAAVVTGLPGSIPSAAARYTLTIATGAGCRWSGSTDVTWASLEPASGVGADTAVLNVEANPDLVGTRSSTITIAGQTLRVAQMNACQFSIDRTRIDVQAEETRVVVRLTTGARCPWTATSAAESWVHAGPTSGEGPAAIEVDVTTNTGVEIRRALVTIAGIRVPVTQQGR